MACTAGYNDVVAVLCKGAVAPLLMSNTSGMDINTFEPYVSPCEFFERIMSPEIEAGQRF